MQLFCTPHTVSLYLKLHPLHMKHLDCSSFALMRAGRRAVARALVLCVVGALFVACGGGNGQPSAQNMSVEDPSLVTVTDTGERAFSATLVNDNQKKVSIAQVSVALFDQGGARVGTTTIEVEDIKAGEKKKFSGPLDTDAPVASAQVQTVMIP